MALQTQPKGSELLVSAGSAYACLCHTCWALRALQKKRERISAQMIFGAKDVGFGRAQDSGKSSLQER